MKITPQLEQYQNDNIRLCGIFAERFQQLKSESGLSLPQIADILGISRQSVVYYTMADRIPGAPILVSIATMFNTSVDYLLGLTDVRHRL